jgi:Arc/MetJ family transcription regulator
MRTNVVIDENLMSQAMAASGLKTKRATIEEALRLFIRLRAQAKILDYAGKVQWEGNLDESRRGRIADEEGLYRP